jgi:enediyne polyketide synthase
VSVAHGAGLTLAVAGRGAQGCDLEPVAARPRPVWRDLLGAEGYRLAGLIAKEGGEDEATAATRVWAARECLKKAGVAPDAPLVFAGALGAGWVALACGRSLVATFRGQVRPAPAPLIVAAFLRDGYACLRLPPRREF